MGMEWFVLALSAALVVWVVVQYNALVRLRNQVRNAWSQIHVQLKRRHDLIPNLVETVRAYAAHERETLDQVIRARGRAVEARSVGEQAQAEGELSRALGRLMLVVEQYPQLRANENFLALQEELTSTENRIGFARQHYNDSVMSFNTRVQSFPAHLIASAFEFREAEFFELEEVADREVPQVVF